MVYLEPAEWRREIRIAWSVDRARTLPFDPRVALDLPRLAESLCPATWTVALPHQRDLAQPAGTSPAVLQVQKARAIGAELEHLLATPSAEPGRDDAIVRLEREFLDAIESGGRLLDSEAQWAVETEADRLVSEVMEARGYPVINFEERAEIVSVDHPIVVENYRAAHQIATGRTRGQATTEGLRKAMVHYRSLFDELLDDEAMERKEMRA